MAALADVRLNVPSFGHGRRMDDTKDEKDITAPPGATHEAGAPPSSPEADRDAVEKGEDKLGQAGAGH